MRRTINYRPLTLSIKPFITRFLLLVFCFFAIFLIYAERQQKSWTQDIRRHVLEAASPFIGLVTQPVEYIESLSRGIEHHWMVHSDNTRLRLENQTLLQWQAAAKRLEAENEALRALLHFRSPNEQHYISARSFGSRQGALAHRTLIDVGMAHGVKKHDVVVNEHGVIGRVIQPAEKHSEVLLLTDMRSRIPVTLQPSGIRALLVGDHSDLPYLKLADPKQQPELGEQVLTAADGALLPSGLFVGKLFAAQKDHYAVLPAFADSSINYVRVIKTAE